MKEKKFDYVVVMIGVLLLGGGFYLVKTVDDPQGIMQALPYVCIGIGSGLFPRAMSQAAALARTFGECREGQIPRSSAAYQI